SAWNTAVPMAESRKAASMPPCTMPSALACCAPGRKARTTRPASIFSNHGPLAAAKPSASVSSRKPGGMDTAQLSYRYAAVHIRLHPPIRTCKLTRSIPCDCWSGWLLAEGGIMSVDEARRFEQDLTNNSELLGKIKSVVSSLASFVEAGKAHGYNFTLADAKQLVRDKVPRHQLSDEQLDAIAAGHGLGGSGGVRGVGGGGSGSPDGVVSGLLRSWGAGPA